MLVERQYPRKRIGHHHLQAASNLQCGLPYLSMPAGSAAALFYQSQGYTYLDEIHDYACYPAGFYRLTAIYYIRPFIME